MKWYHIACGDEIWCYNTITNKDRLVDKYYSDDEVEEITFNKQNLKWFKKHEKFETYEECEKFRNKICYQ